MVMTSPAIRVLVLRRRCARAQTLADDLAKRFPEDTELRFRCLPTVHAQLALTRNDPSKVIELLQAVAPYELGYPAFVRGEAI